MKPGQTSLAAAAISRSAAPSKRGPTWTMRSPSNTTTPSRISVWLSPAKPTTQPPRTSVRIILDGGCDMAPKPPTFVAPRRSRGAPRFPDRRPASGELGVAGGLGGALAVEEDLEVAGVHGDEAGEEQVRERRSDLWGLVGGQQRGGQALARGGVDQRRGDQRRARRRDRGLYDAHPPRHVGRVLLQQLEPVAIDGGDVRAPVHDGVEARALANERADDLAV